MLVLRKVGEEAFELCTDLKWGLGLPLVSFLLYHQQFILTETTCKTPNLANDTGQRGHNKICCRQLTGKTHFKMKV